MNKETFTKKQKQQPNRNWVQEDEMAFTRRAMLKQQQYKRKPKYKNSDEWGNL